MKREAHL